VEVRLVDRDVALKQTTTRRTKWNQVLEQVRTAPEGKVVEVVVWSEGEELPKNHRTRLYNTVALLRQRARKFGMEINVYRGLDGRRIFIERIA
jgi:hypothetical protein